MTTITDKRNPATWVYEIVLVEGNYMVKREGVYLVDHTGQVRIFRTHAGARKRISRDRRGDFHN